MAKEVMVYQANPLIERRWDFSLIEARLFYIGLKDLMPRLTDKVKPWEEMTVKDFPTTRLKPHEITEMFGNDKYYSTLEDICVKLAGKTVKIRRENGKGFSAYPVFLKLDYVPGEGLTLIFNPCMLPWLLDLAGKSFTKIPFEQIWALRSQYSIRLFELLLQYQNTKDHQRTICIEDLRECLGVPLGTYTAMDNFRRRVIDSSIKDINENTKFKVEYENVKEGRKIVAFKFKLHLPADIKREKRKKQIADIGKLTKEVLTASKKGKTSEVQPVGDYDEPVIIDKKTGKVVSK